MIKSVIFDCFGVLTEDGWLAFVGKYRTPENADELGYLNHQLDKGLIEYTEFLEEVCKVTGVEKNEVHKMVTTSHHPNEILFEYIQQLKNAGYVLGVISNVGAPLNDYLPQKLVDLFDHITLSYEVGVIKPDPRIYEYCIERIGFAPAECVFIDDREPNVQGAINVGMKGLLYQNTVDLIRELAQLGVKPNLS